MSLHLQEPPTSTATFQTTAEWSYETDRLCTVCPRPSVVPEGRDSSRQGCEQGPSTEAGAARSQSQRALEKQAGSAKA
uniref:Uncharacterized protein n=1 Tax=Knipowitschia caucasica TaxID=637954 RepID=A0AAV2LV07_KNICA